MLVEVFPQIQASVVASCVSGQVSSDTDQCSGQLCVSGRVSSDTNQCSGQLCVSGLVSSDTDQCSGQLMVQTGFALCFFVHRCMSALKLGYQQKSRTALNCWCQQQIRGRIDLPVSL